MGAHHLFRYTSFGGNEGSKRPVVSVGMAPTHAVIPTE